MVNTKLESPRFPPKHRTSLRFSAAFVFQAFPEQPSSKAHTSGEIILTSLSSAKVKPVRHRTVALMQNSGSLLCVVDEPEGPGFLESKVRGRSKRPD